MNYQTKTYCRLIARNAMLSKKDRKDIVYSIYKGLGLNFCFISALKSISNPSLTRQSRIRPIPMKEELSTWMEFALLPQKNMITPMETMTPTISFSLPNFSSPY